MRIRALFVTMAGLFAASPAFAQGTRAPTVDIVPQAGYMIFGDFIKGPLGTSLANANGPLLGAQVGLHLAPAIALIGNVGYASSDLKIGAPIIGGITVGSSNAWLVDGGLELRVPTANGISPFVQAGAGVIRNEIDNDLFTVRATNFAVNGGVGVDLQMTPNFGLRLMAKDYVGRFDVKEATLLDVEGRTAHNVALTVGIKLAF